MRAPLPWKKAPQGERHADDDRFVEEKQDQRAADDFFERIGDVEAGEEGRADLGHRRRPQRDNEAEKERQKEKRDAERHARARRERDDARKIDDRRRAGADGRKPEQLVERLRRAPQNAVPVAQQCEGADHGEVDGEVHGLPGHLARGAQQKERRARKKSRDQEMVAPAGSLEGRHHGEDEAEKDTLEQSAASVRFAMGVARHGFPPGRPEIGAAYG